MMQLNVHSQNMRGSLKRYTENIVNAMNNTDCECTAFFLQDLGTTGPDGPNILRDHLGDHGCYANSKSTNKSRTVAIILNKEALQTGLPRPNGVSGGRRCLSCWN